MVQVDFESVKKSADILRDLKNWVAVFNNEDELSKEARQKLMSQIDKIAKDLADVHCVLKDKEAKVSDAACDRATDVMRDFKNWVEIFKTENEVKGEAEQMLNDTVGKLAESIANIKCK
jgi:gas vesicle protein